MSTPGAKFAIMRFFRIFFAPLALLLIGAATAAEESSALGAMTQSKDATLAWHMPAWRQVRIEQRFSIRITPGTASMPPSVIEELEEDRIEGVEARKSGKCVSIGSIAAVRAGDNNELLLFLHDQRVISAMLEKHCSARDFYSGFYVERNADGAICVGRDRLQSRSGANCRVKRLNELRPAGYRRFP